ncbi:MAG: TlpA family protein disulfide reductase [Kiritimatiellia bacterium]
MKRFLAFVLSLALVSLGAAVRIVLRRPDTPVAGWLYAQYDRYAPASFPRRAQPTAMAAEDTAGENAEVPVEEPPQLPDGPAEPVAVPAPPPKVFSAPPVAEESVDGVSAPVAATGSAEETPKKKAKPFSKENWYAGKRLTAADVRGKTVLVYLFDVADERSVAMLSRVQRTWEGFRHKPFTVIGSHRGARSNKVVKVLKARKVTFPVYQDAFLPGEPANIPELPYFYVIEPNGRLGYCGRGDMEATEAVVNSISNSIGH